ncbi:hypothetical protein PO909_023941 [Leuciscus waleckii]
MSERTVPKLEAQPVEGEESEFFTGTGCTIPVSVAAIIPLCAPALVRVFHFLKEQHSTLHGGAVKGYEAIRPVERSAAASWTGDPHLPSKPCEFSSILTGKAYKDCGQAASSLHTMALLQVYQAKALMDMHKGSPDRALIGELRTATDPAAPLPLGYRSSLQPVLSVEPATGRPPSPSWALANRPSIPETGHPGIGERALQMVTVPLLAPRSSAVPDKKEPIPLFLGPKRARLVVCDPVKPCTPQPPLIASWQLGAVRGHGHAFSCTHCRYVETEVLLAKDAIEPVPPADLKTGFYSPYFIVLKKGDFDLKDAYFRSLPFRNAGHAGILAFEGSKSQYNVPPFECYIANWVFRLESDLRKRMKWPGVNSP